jgi:hypothetical protein
MLVRILETGKMEELAVKDEVGQDYASEVMATAGYPIEYDSEGAVGMTLEDYQWWTEYFESYEISRKQIRELAEKLGMNEDDIWLRVNQSLSSDYEEHHIEVQEVLEEIKAEQRTETETLSEMERAKYA